MIDLRSWAETLGLRRKRSLVERVQDVADDVVDRATGALGAMGAMGSLGAVGGMMPSMGRGKGPIDSVSENVSPVIDKASRVAERAWARTARTTSSGVSGAADMAGDAASAVTSTAAATGAKAAGMAVGVGAILAGLFSRLWSAAMFMMKAAILVGVAYAGWQWLQSRREEQSWNAGTGSTMSSSMYGTVRSTGAGSTATVGGAH